MVADYLNLPSKSVSAALAKVGLRGQENKKVVDYSLGMKQQLSIAMALTSSPDLLLLDEPINGLDAEAVVDVRQMNMDLAASEGVTVIISSHILSEIVKMALIVGIIAPGRLLYQGSLEKLQKEGHINLRVTDPQLASGVLECKDIDYKYIWESGIL